MKKILRRATIALFAAAGVFALVGITQEAEAGMKVKVTIDNQSGKTITVGNIKYKPENYSDYKKVWKGSTSLSNGSTLLKVKEHTRPYDDTKPVRIKINYKCNGTWYKKKSQFFSTTSGNFTVKARISSTCSVAWTHKNV